MMFPTDFLDSLRERAQLSEVIGQKVRLQKQGKELVGLCPFHKEKTPSFHVNDTKGSYYCFGCGVHGDVFRFLTEAYQYSFTDAVEEVARKTNTALPQQTMPSEELKKQADQREKLLEIHEAVACWFQQQLQTNRGYHVQEYLRKRGIKDSIIKQFRLGFAPSGNALQKEFLQKGYSESDLLEAGLLGQGDNGLYERFRDRLMFPIFSTQGKVIAFGGRVLGDALPKYLNSPETPLFHKKECLFGLHLLKSSSRKQANVYVVEGYMDVIAMVQAGVGPAVAPLGTALTEEQIMALWKYCPEPVLCFDGDTAGLNAANRAAERVLPILKAGYSLNFSLLPKGEDPDSLIRSGSLKILQDLLKTPRSLFQMLSDHFVLNKSIKTPEQQALVRNEFMALLEQIKDLSVYYPYRAAVSELFFKVFRRVKRTDKNNVPANTLSGVLTKFDVRKRQRSILFAVILNHPQLLESIEDNFTRLPLPDHEEELIHFRDEIFLYYSQGLDLDAASLQHHMILRGYEQFLTSVLSDDIYQHAAFAKPSANIDQAREGWQEVWHMLEGNDMLSEQREHMRHELLESMDSESWMRFKALQEQAVKN